MRLYYVPDSRYEGYDGKEKTKFSAPTDHLQISKMYSMANDSKCCGETARKKDVSPRGGPQY